MDLEKEIKTIEELDELKTEFVSLVSHELRTPAGLVNGYLQVALDEYGADLNPEIRKYLEVANKNAMRLTRIIQELTDFSRLQLEETSGKGVFMPLGLAIEQVIEIFEPYIKSKKLDLKVDITKKIRNLEFDGESLIIIFRNLLSNSIKFSANKGVIRIKASRNASKKLNRVSIIDLASTIPEEKRGNIFDDFRQVENYLTRRYEGMGLGLAVASRTARKHGWDIVHKPRSVGNVFEVTFPFGS